MRTKREYQHDREDIECAKVRLMIVLQAHSGYFWSTSEFAASTGMLRTINRIAIDELVAVGGIKRRSVAGGAAYEMREQQPGPLIEATITRCHRASMTQNEHGSDCHPWRNSTLACPICAMLRTAQPEWRVTAESLDAVQPNGKYTSRQKFVDTGQMGLGRQSRTKR